MRCVFELSSGRDRSSRSAWSLHAQVFGEAAPPVVNDWLICLVHVANLHNRTDYGVADSLAERRFRRFCRVDLGRRKEGRSYPLMDRPPEAVAQRIDRAMVRLSARPKGCR